MRSFNRGPHDLRPVEIIRRFTTSPAGSVLIRAGHTHVLCTASLVEGVPEWRMPSGKGWLTAEYDMLPASTGARRERTRKRLDGRTQEIQRLIGRSLRAVVDMTQMGQHTIYLDCDVLQADGGTRTAAVTGAYVALCDALAEGRRRQWWGDELRATAVAAVSVGLVGGEVLVDLDYKEDASAEVDCNLVMSAGGGWIEVQATGERSTFSDAHLAQFTGVGRSAIEQLFEHQRRALAAG